MTSFKNEISTNEENNEKKYWLEMHAELQDLLAGYVDDELNTEQVLRIEAHLSGCTQCRDDLSRQKILISHIESTTATRMPNSLQQKINQKLSNSITPPIKPNTFYYFYQWVKLFFLNVNAKQKLITSSGWIVAATLLIIILSPVTVHYQNAKFASNIPMVNDVLNEYQQIQQRNLPEAGQDMKRTVSWQNANVLTSWITKVGGVPAKVFAVRYNNQMILQVEIDQKIFFRNADVRQAVAKMGYYSNKNDNFEVLAMPTAEAGLIIVGPANMLPEYDSIIES